MNDIINIPYASNVGTGMTIVITFSLIIFRIILHGCIDTANSGLNGGEILILNAEETMQFLHGIGVAFLAEHGTFFTLITSYLLHVGNLHSLLESDLSFGILDRTILANMLPQIKCLIDNHELIFSVVDNLSELQDHFDTRIGFDANELQLRIRESGNDLISLYRNIERQLGIEIENSALPIH
jgi:hypothetical protein